MLVPGDGARMRVVLRDSKPEILASTPGVCEILAS